VDAAARATSVARLIEEHLNLVRSIATQVRRTVSKRIELDDLVAYGTKGLIEAAERYDARFGVKFSTFAYHRVRGAIFDGLREMGHLPRHEYAKLKMAERSNQILENLAEREYAATQQGAPPPAVDEEVRAMHEAIAQVDTSRVTSLEALADKGVQLGQDAGVPAEERIDLSRITGRVRAILPRLPEKERFFIEKHYFEGKTLLEAGAALGLSKSWASRLHARALALLRAELGVT
jgi:RNA polymerase sigma factor for flagellar operon FliA